MRIVTRGIVIAFGTVILAGWTLPTPVETVLLRFTPGGSDGGYPTAGLIADEQGALYGTTIQGGIGYGTVFKLTPPANGQKTWTETLLYSFKGGNSDGATPVAGLITDKQGALYGTTIFGGLGGCTPSGCGTVFKLTPAKGQNVWTETVLYKFTGRDGANPYAGLIADKEGTLFGTTEQGGSSGYGTVFKLMPPAKNQTVWTETVLHSFTGYSITSPDGAYPQAGLIADKEGALFSTTQGGGSGGYGTVFKLTPPAKGQTAWTEKLLYSFKGGGSDGAIPFANLIADEQGALYSTTSQGGNSNCGLGCGTVFKLAPPAKDQTAWTETLLYSFKGAPDDGWAPKAGLIADKRDALYATTQAGGTANAGTVFKLTPPARGQTAWTETVLYSFKGGADGDDPSAGLIADKLGTLYGTTSGNGFGGGGTVFNLKTAVGAGQVADF